VSAYWNAVQEWLADTRLARRVTEAVFHVRSRYELTHLDRQAPGRDQVRTLLGLLHQARATRFGREHDFGRIRTVEDFRRLVPVRTPAELWRGYWQPAFPHLGGVTWPGPLPYLATFRAPSARVPVALSPALQAAYRAALRTALAFVVSARPRCGLFSGRLLFLGDDSTLTAGNPEAMAAERLPALVRPYAVAPIADSKTKTRTAAVAAASAFCNPQSAIRNPQWEEALAEQAARMKVTCLAGDAERIVPLIERVKQVTGKDELARVWPELAAVLYTRRSSAAPVTRLRAEVGPRVLLLETVFHPAAPVAVTDPHWGMLRVLSDHGAYFEFVPAEEAGRPGARRHGLGEVETGVPYELVVTSPAGLWACRLGSTVCFERRDPPLIRLLEAPTTTRPGVPAPVLTAPAPRPQNDGSPAALPGSIFHSPWSTPADRG
jgi:GH3 auxin-responsive promoter